MDIYKILQKQMEQEMNKMFGISQEYLNTTSASTTQVSTGLTLESLQKLVDSIPKPKYITLSNYLPRDNNVYIFDDEQYTHPNTARLIISKEPYMINYIKNKELL